MAMPSFAGPIMVARPVIFVEMENLPEEDFHIEFEMVQKVLKDANTMKLLGCDAAKLKLHMLDLEAEMRRRLRLAYAKAAITKTTRPTKAERIAVKEKISTLIKQSVELAKENYSPNSYQFTRIYDVSWARFGDLFRSRKKCWEFSDCLGWMTKLKYIESLFRPKRWINQSSLEQCKVEDGREVARKKEKEEESQVKKTAGKRSGHVKVNGVNSRYAVPPKKKSG